MITTDRRRFLRGLSLAAATVATGSVVVAATPRHPTRKELELYYGLLWMEFKSLSEELGVEMHDSYIMHKDGNYERIKAAFSGSQPSARALPVLGAAGLTSSVGAL